MTWLDCGQLRVHSTQKHSNPVCINLWILQGPESSELKWLLKLLSQLSLCCFKRCFKKLPWWVFVQWIRWTHLCRFSIPNTKESVFSLATKTHLKKYLLPHPNPSSSPIHRLFLGSGLAWNSFSYHIEIRGEKKKKKISTFPWHSESLDFLIIPKLPPNTSCQLVGTQRGSLESETLYSCLEYS